MGVAKNQQQEKKDAKKQAAALKAALGGAASAEANWAWADPPLVIWLLAWAHDADAALFFGYNRDRTTYVLSFYIDTVKEKYYISGSDDLNGELRKLCNVLAEIGG